MSEGLELEMRQDLVNSVADDDAGMVSKSSLPPQCCDVRNLYSS